MYMRVFGGHRAGQSKQQSHPILTCIDRKINGALIQDLAGRGEGGKWEDCWRRKNEQQRREENKEDGVNKEGK